MIKIGILLLSVLSLSSSLYLSNKIDPIVCPANTTLQGKFGYIPVPSGGCGENKFELKLNSALDPFIAALSPCCIAHDICFKTCDTSGDNKATFNKCNQDFKTCLTNVCGLLPWFVKPLCQGWQVGYSASLGKFGGHFFSNDQKEACECK